MKQNPSQAASSKQEGGSMSRAPKGCQRTQLPDKGMGFRSDRLSTNIEATALVIPRDTQVVTENEHGRMARERNVDDGKGESDG